MRNVVYIRASAGSGKTYRLSSQYLGILLRHPDLDPAAILATTFTRAAAREILDRVLRRLAEAVLDERKRAALARDTGVALGRAECERGLKRVACHLHRVSVGTIDAFFGRVARAMPDRLGLPHAWRIASEAQAEVLSAEVALSLLAGGSSEELRRHWIAWSRHRARAGAWDGLVALLDAARFARLAPPEAYRVEAVPRLGGDAELLRVAAARAPLPTTRNGAVDGRFRKAMAALEAAALPGARLDLFHEHCALLDRVLDGTRMYCGKAIPEELCAALDPLARKLRALYPALFADQQSALAALQALYAPARDAAAVARGALTFAEVEQRVKRGAPAADPEGGAWDDLYFVLDGRVQHLLFDEFQDTSWSQFEFFEPMIAECQAEPEERSVFVVGDPKQAIYGWRGGDRDVIDAFPHRFRADVEALNRSYRSSRAVLEAVDAVFGGLPGIAEAFAAPFSDAAAAWLREGDGALAYRRHEAEHADLRGEVAVWQADEEDFVECVAERVQALRSMEEPPEQIAVLLRRNRHIPRIVDALRLKAGIADVAAGSSGSAITDSFAVEVLLAALTFMDHPGRRSAAARLASRACWAAELAAEGDDAWSRQWAVARAWRERWSRQGAEGLIGGWLADPGFQGRLTTHDRLRCAQLLALARQFDRSASTRRPDELVECARLERLSASRPAAVRVMSVHAAKGLEFDGVVLADLDSPRGGGDFGRPQFLRDEGGDDVLVPSERKFARWCGAEERYRHLRRKQMMEELSVLYVGMTRARSFLHIVVDARDVQAAEDVLRGKAKDLSPHAGTLVLAALRAGGGSEAAEGGALWQRRRDGRSWTGRVEEIVLEPDAAFAGRADVPAAGVPAWLEPRSPSAREPGKPMPLRDVFQRDISRRSLGLAVHAWLAAIEWAEDAERLGGPEGDRAEADRLLDATAADWAGMGRERARARLVGLLEEIAAGRGDLGRVFDRAGYARRWGVAAEKIEVWRERPFTVPREGILWSGRFDRVVFTRNARGDVAQAEVVDFKTDAAPEPDAPAGRRPAHAAQMQAYAEVLRHAWRGQAVAPEVTTSLVFVEAGPGERGDAGEGRRVAPR